MLRSGAFCPLPAASAAVPPRIVVIAAAVRMTDIFFIMMTPFLEPFRYPEGYFFFFTSNTIETEDIIHEKIIFSIIYDARVKIPFDPNIILYL